MRIPILIAAMLALSGCVDLLPKEGPSVEPASTDDATPEPATPTSEAAPPAEPEPSAAPEPEPVAATPPAEEPPTEPPAPVLVPWALAGEAKVGFVADASGPNAPPHEGHQDAEHCAESTFTLAEGASYLKLAVSPGDGAPPESGAGMLDIVIVAPDGTQTRISPMDDLRGIAEGTEAPDGIETDAPAVGLWTLRAEALGPAVMRVYTVAIEAEGASEVAPTDLLVTSACS